MQERNVREKTKFALKRIIVYDTLKKELELSDGGVLRIDSSFCCSSCKRENA